MRAKDRTAAPPTDSPEGVPAPESSSQGSSGSGASTALTAMLKKRQQRANHDSELPKTDEVVLPEGQ